MPRKWMWICFALSCVLVIEVAATEIAAPVLESGATAACFRYLGHCADVWTAIGTVGLLAATFALVLFGAFQTFKILDDARLNRSLAACDRYDHDPVIDRCLRRIRRRERVWLNPLDYRIDVSTLLNYLDGLASGAENNTYSKKFVLMHMRSIMLYHAQEFLSEKAMREFGLAKGDYEALLKLVGLWDAK